MPVRIYSLAKELKLDSKELVDLCTKAGIPGKGSALASLTDDEVAKVKEFMSGGAPKPAKRAAPAAKTSSAAATATVTAAAPRPTRAKSAEPAPLRPEDYIAPGGVTGKMPVLDAKTRKPASIEAKKKAERTDGPKPAPRGPSIQLAPLPPSEAPRVEAKSNEPAPQKPDLKLPADAIRAGKSGGRPLADHLKKHEETAKAAKDAEAKAKSGRRGRFPEKEAEPAGEAPLRGKGRRGKGDKAGDDKSLLGGREARQLKRKRIGARDDETSRPRRSNRRLRRSGASANTAAPRKSQVTVTLPCTVRDLSEASGVPVAEIQRILLREGTMAPVTAQLDPDMTEMIAEELEFDIEFREAVNREDELLSEIRDRVDEPESLEMRPPIITFLGHVDHGKTSLLDSILGIDVVSGESGGITQHIRAYQIEKDGGRISFVDTPGHEAFTEMRARGANVTDIAVLVVAADDGVMPQTEEAISHARAAEVPIVVALNKIDLPGVDVNRAMQGLSANELLPSEWGGDVEVIKTSATTGEGIDELLDTLLTVAELHDYKANPQRDAMGTCVEAFQEQGRGVVAKLIVQTGTLRVGDVLVCGQAHGKVKAMYDTLNPRVKLTEAGPSMPVNITGFDIAPGAGDHFYALRDVAQARTIAQRHADAERTESLVDTRPHVTLENLFERLEGEGEVATLNLILRADVRGSIEAVQHELAKLVHEEVRIRVLQATVGGISEADVHLADASDAIIIGFNVVPDEAARQLADRRGVQIRRYEIIYKLSEDIKAALEGMLKPEEREVELGRALVQQTFTISRMGTIAGCRVLSGTIERNTRARVIRNNTIIGDYPLASLRRIKDDVKEVREGMECGIRLDGFNDLKEADILEDYKVEEVGRKFDD